MHVYSDKIRNIRICLTPKTPPTQNVRNTAKSNKIYYVAQVQDTVCWWPHLNWQDGLKMTFCQNSTEYILHLPKKNIYFEEKQIMIMLVEQPLALSGSVNK